MPQNRAIDALVALQQLDLDIERVGHDIAAATNGLADERAVHEAQTTAQRAQQAERAATIELHDAEATLTDTEAKIARNEKRLASGVVSSPKDIAAVEHELEFLRHQRGETDERVLIAMDALEVAKATAQTATTNLATIQRDRAAERERQATQLATARERQILLGPQRVEAAAETDPTLLARYEAIRKTRGRAVVNVVNGTCQGCRVALQPTVVQKLRAARGNDEIVTCGNCGRILIPG